MASDPNTPGGDDGPEADEEQLHDLRERRKQQEEKKRMEQSRKWQIEKEEEQHDDKKMREEKKGKKSQGKHMPSGISVPRMSIYPLSYSIPFRFSAKNVKTVKAQSRMEKVKIE